MRFDPFEPTVLEGWQLANLHYQPLTPNGRGWLWCEALGLWLGTWQGTLDRETALWLRFYDEAGRLVLLPEEAAREQAEQKRQQREALARRLRELGFNPDNLTQ
jgi:hypothetical protein